MGTLTEKYESMSTEELDAMLRRDCFGAAPLDPDEILAICAVLAKRRPPRHTAQEAHREYEKHYKPQI